ncbi:MAG: EAL domain-containing protein [Lachnospiraceae bacterium]|nr:EAL domain-containing protein [Lachnospiraceae bacterium]
MAKRRRIVGVLISDAHHSFFKQCLYYVQKELLRNDADVVTFTTLCRAGMDRSYSDAECSVYEVMNLHELDGLIIYPTTFYMERQKEVLEQIRRDFDKPVVCLEHENEYGFPTVPFGRENGMELLIGHLVTRHGAQRIRFVAGSRNPEVPYDRALQEDFLRAMEKNGLAADEGEFFEGGFWIHSGEEIADALCASEEGLPDAVVCVSDECAAALVSAFETRGVRVPEDVIVAGYGSDSDKPGGEYLSVYRDPAEMSRNAVRMLFAQMDGREQFLLQHSGGCCRLIPGGSCGCSRNSSGAYSNLWLETLRDQTERFPSEFNFMSEEVTNVTDIRECLRTVDRFTEYLGNYEAFYLCLNENALHEREESRNLTDKMEMAISHEKESCSFGDGRMFSREFMIPALYRESDVPRVFYVAPLHFMERVLGYEVITYGNSPEVFSPCLRGWTRKLAHCLETQRRWYMYDDMTVQNQVRDAMTGLFNYKGYIGALQDMYRHLGGKPVKLRVIALDIERFSTINDAYGREEGNEVLLALTKIIQNTMNDRDICARFGNDEFVIAGFYETHNDAQGLLTNLLARVQNYNNFNRKSYSVDLAYAKSCEDVVDENSLAQITADVLADKKAYKENKRRNAGGPDIYNEEERREVTRVLDDNLFAYHFQPIINAKTGDIYAYEALMRMPEQSLTPDTVLRHAEALDRLYDVERHTFFNSLEIVRNHQDELKGRKLFINSIPSVIINDKDYGKLVSAYGDILSGIVIEFTEQTEATGEQVALIKKRCAENGMQLAVDDYGTGYSNISNLLNYAPDYVKIDRSLISGVDEDNKKQYFVSNTVEFAHENGFLALAEGVETREELNTVIRLGIDLVQGYYTMRPQETFVAEIPKEMCDEIVRMNLRNIDTRQKKTYIVGNENEVQIIPLVMDGYTEVVVPRQDCVLVGNPRHTADIVVHVPDNTITRIHLRSLELESYQRRPCIEIGNRSDVTLVIEGNVTMQDAGIRVPESSSLTIEGKGKLFINVSADRSYAIGGDCNQSVGRIVLNMDGELTIHGDGRECVGIGGGYLRDTGIRIEKCKNIYLTMTGEQIVGIGSSSSQALISAQNTRIISRVNSDRGVGIGSVSGDARVDLRNARVACIASGDTQVGVGTLLHDATTVRLLDCEFQTEMKAKRCVGIGTRTGTASVRIIGSTLNLRGEGSSVIGVGSAERLGRGQFEMSTMNFHLASASGIPFGFTEEAMNFLKCTVTGVRDDDE